MMQSDTLSDKIAEKIKNDIQNGLLQDGDIISEKELSLELGVSRTPIREALRSLMNDGILDKIYRKGYVVKGISPKDKEDTYLVFSTLESLAAVLAVDFLDQTDIRHMQELIDKMDIAIKYRNAIEYYDLNNAFHEVYISKCDNRPLIQMIHTLEHGTVNRSYVGISEQEMFEGFANCNKEHREILNLFETKDKAGLDEMHRLSHWR